MINDNHPETRVGEMYLTNSDTAGYGMIGWKSKRKGLRAYSKKDKVIAQLFPVFIQKQEYEEGIKNKRGN